MEKEPARQGANDIKHPGRTDINPLAYEILVLNRLSLNSEGSRK
jgi:hypothetical protein